MCRVSPSWSRNSSAVIHLGTPYVYIKNIGKRVRSCKAQRVYYTTSPEYETVGLTHTLILVSVQR